MLWNVKKIRIKKIVTVHILAVEKVFAAIVLLITEKWGSYQPVISRMMWKEPMTVLFQNFWKRFRNAGIIGIKVWIKLDVIGLKSL